MLSMFSIEQSMEKNKEIGSSSVNDIATKMKISKGRVVQLTMSAFRKLRWTIRMKGIEEFFNEYDN